MSRHDHLWKSLLQAFLPEFLELVQPEILEKYQARGAVFLEQEAFRDPLAGSYSKMDLVAQLPAREGSAGLLLVLIEVEARFRREMDERVLAYFRHLRLKHQEMVLPIVLFLRGGPAGLEKRLVRESVMSFDVVCFNYWAFGLSRAEAEEFLGRNRLTPALAACMRSKIWRPSEKKLQCLLSILEAPVDDSQRFLLVNAVETYLDLAEEEAMNYAELVAMSTRGQEVEAMELTWADKIERRGRIRGRDEGLLKGRSEGLKQGRSEGLQRGRSEGLQQGRSEGLQQGRSEGLQQGRSEGVRKMIGLVLEERFGELNPSSRRRFEAIEDIEELENLGRRLLKAETLADLGL